MTSIVITTIKATYFFIFSNFGFKVIIFEQFKKMNLIVFQYPYISRLIIVKSFQKKTY